MNDNFLHIATTDFKEFKIDYIIISFKFPASIDKAFAYLISNNEAIARTCLYDTIDLLNFLQKEQYKYLVSATVQQLIDFYLYYV